MYRESERKRLVELIGNCTASCYLPTAIIRVLADHLLDNGVIVPPCKVGDKVYYFSHRPFSLSVKANTVYEADVVRIVTTRLGTQLVIQIREAGWVTEIPDIRSWGETLFATREEALKALEGKEDKGK